MADLFGGLSTPKWKDPMEDSDRNAQIAMQLTTNWMRMQDLKQQSAEQAAIFPLKIAQTHQAIESTRVNTQAQILQMERDRNALEYQTQAKEGEATFARALSEVGKSGDWDKPESRAKLWDVATKYPALLDTPIWKQTQDNFMKADKAAAEAQHWKEMAEVGKERESALQAKIDAGPKETQLVDEIQRTEKAASDALAKGDKATYDSMTERANLLKEAMPSHGTEELTGYSNEGYPIFRMTRGKGGAAATVATQSLGQQKLAKYENATQLINGLQNTLRPMDVGAAGVAGEYLGDRLGAQVPGFEGLFSQQRVDNRTVLGAVRESLMREMGDDRRFTAKDREDIANILPSTGVLESYSDAKARLQKVKDIIVDRTRVYANRVGEPVPDFAKTKDEIASEFQKKKAAIQKAMELGTLDKTEGQKEIDDAYARAHDALVRFH